MPGPIVTVGQEAIKSDLRKLVRRTVEDTLNGLLEEEADDLVGAGRYERTLTTTSDDVTLRMPKPKDARFATAVIERYRGRETSVEKAMIETCLAGVSTRRIEDVSEALLGAGFAETLAYTGFPPQHWRRIRTNNAVERPDWEIRRRTRVVGTFPDGESALMLVTARLRYVADSEWGSRRYLDVTLLDEEPYRRAGD